MAKITSFFQPKEGTKRKKTDEDGRASIKRIKVDLSELSDEAKELLNFLSDPQEEDTKNNNNNNDNDEEQDQKMAKKEQKDKDEKEGDTDDEDGNSKENEQNKTVVTWREAMHPHFKSESFNKLAKYVLAERKSQTIFPPPEDTFSALDWTPLHEVKVVIIGQDPYHGPRQAHGLCFSVHKGIKIPPSLRNIYKELINDENVPNFNTMPTHGYLERWAKQGVLMINSVLTVRQGKPFSHKNQGWEVVTEEIIRAAERYSKTGLVFLMWGKPAAEKKKLLAQQHKHKFICTSHPSPLGASKTNAPFLGSKCFSKANKALKAMGHSEIDWNVDGDL